MSNSIHGDFLEHATQTGMALAADSDVLKLTRIPNADVGMFVAEFSVAYLTDRSGRIEMAPGPLALGILLGPDYLRRVSPLELVQVREPDLWHPNVLWPVVCVGGVRPGMPLPKLLKHLYEIVTYRNYATDDGLNREACARLRDEPTLLQLLPPAPRLVRRKLDLV